MNEIISTDERLFRNRMKWAMCFNMIADEELIDKYGAEVVCGVALGYGCCRDIEPPTREEIEKMCEEVSKKL